MTAQIRISKMVVAALLSVGVSAGSLIVPTESRAQAAANATVVSITVKPESEKKAVGCDVKLNLENLPQGRTAEFTTTCPPGATNCTPQTYKNLHTGTYCLQNGVLTATSAGGPPAVAPPGGPGGCTPRTVIINGSPVTICE